MVMTLITMKMNNMKVSFHNYAKIVKKLLIYINDNV